MQKLFYFLLVFFASISICYGAPVSEVPGDGLDDSLFTGGSQIAPIGSCPAGYMDAVYGTSTVTAPAGCDRKCAAPDEDCDGYTSDGSLGRAGTTFKDTNDHDRREIPTGVDYYPCDAGGGPNSGYHLANTNGTYGTCTANSVTPLCEATAPGAVCKYVHCGTGNDLNAGTYAAPYLTFSPTTSLPNGSYVYHIGGVCNAGADYSAKSDITVEGYPGSSGSFNLVNVGGFEASINFKVIALSFTGVCNTTGANMTPVHQLSKNGFEARRCVFLHTTMSSFNNNSDIYLNSTNTANIHHNLFYDWQQGSGGCNNPGNGGNTHALHLLADPGAGWGSGITGKFNVFIQPTPMAISSAGGASKYKHGVTCSDTGGSAPNYNGTDISYNFFVNVGQAAAEWSSGCIRLHHNLQVGDGSLLFTSPDSSAPQLDEQVYNNTIVGGATLLRIDPNYTGNESYVYHDNIVYDTRSAYLDHAGENDIDPYGSDAQETALRANNSGAGSFFGDHNCYFNPNIAANFAYFSKPSGSGGHGPAGNAGGNYTFTQWSAFTTPGHGTNTGQQTDLVGSFLQDPLLNNFYQATSVGCLDKGVFPLASPTPVPGPAVAAGVVGKLKKTLK